MLVEVRTGGANLPVRPTDDAGLLGMVRSGEWFLFGVYFYHAIAFCIVLAMTLIRWDRQPIPIRLIVYSLLLALLPPIFWSDLRPVHFPVAALGTSAELAGLIDGVAGAAAGFLVGWLLHACVRAAELRIIVSVLGCFFGWQAAISIGLITAIALVIIAISTRVLRTANAVPQAVAVIISAVIHLVFWRWLSQYSWWPGHKATIATLAIAVIASAALAAVARLIQRADQDAPTAT